MYLSPAIIERSIGAAPLHLGKIEAWILRQPKRGNSKTSFGKIIPYADTMIISGAISSRVLIESFSLKFKGVKRTDLIC